MARGQPTNSAPTQFIRGSFYVFGGAVNGESSSALVVHFNPRTHEWFNGLIQALSLTYIFFKKGGNLVRPRLGHSVIKTGNEFLIIGGDAKIEVFVNFRFQKITF